MEIIQQRKQTLIQEEATGTKAAGKDILTLLIRANVHDIEGGMSDEAVLARSSRSLRCPTRFDWLTPFRNTNVPDCWARDDECRYNLGLVWVELKFGSSEEAQGGAPYAQH